MAYGLIVRDGAGNIQIDTGTRLTRILGTFNTGVTNGSITDSNLSQGTPFWFIVDGYGSGDGYTADISASGTTISWTITGSPKIACNVVYGVY